MNKFTNEEYKKIFDESYPTLELLSEYNGNKNYIAVRCKIHNYIFNTKPNWLKRGSGCIKCYNDRRGDSCRKTREQFITESKLIHGDKYDYSKVDYVNNRTKVTIICPIHGEFEKTPGKHLDGQGCPECSKIENSVNKRLTIEEFISRSKDKHGNKYDYSKVEYVNCDSKIKIICPIHGEFEQIAYNHMCGQGCPLCNESHIESEVCKLLIDNNVKFERQKRFNWLGRQSLDFYLPEYNIAIECQGEQHFKPIEFFGGIKGFEKTIKRDRIKNKLCSENNIKLIYVVNKNIICETSDFYNKSNILYI